MSVGQSVEQCQICDTLVIFQNTVASLISMICCLLSVEWNLTNVLTIVQCYWPVVSLWWYPGWYHIWYLSITMDYGCSVPQVSYDQWAPTLKSGTFLSMWARSSIIFSSSQAGSSDLAVNDDFMGMMSRLHCWDNFIWDFPWLLLCSIFVLNYTRNLI